MPERTFSHVRSNIYVSISYDTLKLNKRKERQEKLIYRDRNIQHIHKKIHKRVSVDEICTYCSMNKQYMKGVQKQ